MSSAKSVRTSPAAAARAARRRAGWKIVVADSLAEAEAETRAYWRNATPAISICLHHGVKKLWSADRDFTSFPDLISENPLVR